MAGAGARREHCLVLGKNGQLWRQAAPAVSNTRSYLEDILDGYQVSLTLLLVIQGQIYGDRGYHLL